MRRSTRPIIPKSTGVSIPSRSTNILPGYVSVEEPVSKDSYKKTRAERSRMMSGSNPLLSAPRHRQFAIHRRSVEDPPAGPLPINSTHNPSMSRRNGQSSLPPPLRGADPSLFRSSPEKSRQYPLVAPPDWRKTSATKASQKKRSRSRAKRSSTSGRNTFTDVPPIRCLCEMNLGD